MEWLEIFKNENIVQAIADYTLALGFLGTVIGLACKYLIPGKKDDEFWQAVKDQFKLVKK